MTRTHPTGPKTVFEKTLRPRVRPPRSDVSDVPCRPARPIPFPSAFRGEHAHTRTHTHGGHNEGPAEIIRPRRRCASPGLLISRRPRRPLRRDPVRAPGPPNARVYGTHARTRATAESSATADDAFAPESFAGRTGTCSRVNYADCGRGTSSTATRRRKVTKTKDVVNNVALCYAAKDFCPPPVMRPNEIV